MLAARRFWEIDAYYTWWRAVRAGLSRRLAVVASTSKRHWAVRAWFKTGLGSVVRSTLEAVSATVPDPVLTQERKPRGWGAMEET